MFFCVNESFVPGDKSLNSVSYVNFLNIGGDFLLLSDSDFGFLLVVTSLRWNKPWSLTDVASSLSPLTTAVWLSLTVCVAAFVRPASAWIRSRRSFTSSWSVWTGLCGFWSTAVLHVFFHVTVKRQVLLKMLITAFSLFSFLPEILIFLRLCNDAWGFFFTHKHESKLKVWSLAQSYIMRPMYGGLKWF